MKTYTGSKIDNSTINFDEPINYNKYKDEVNDTRSEKIGYLCIRLFKKWFKFRKIFQNR